MNEAILIIKQYEGFSAKPYLCPANVCTVGYGHVIRDGGGNMLKGQAGMVKAHEAYPFPIDEDEATLILMEDAIKVACDITKIVKVGLNDNQMAALVSLVFNIGIGNFKHSTLLRKLNKGLYDEIPDEIRRWIRAGGKVLNGLVSRREAEVGLWQATTL